MCDLIASKLVLFFLLYHDVFVLANVYDCWDPDKLQKMKFKETKGKFILKQSCHYPFTQAFSALQCILKVVTLVPEVSVMPLKIHFGKHRCKRGTRKT